MDTRLYSYFRSSSAYRVRIALHLKGLDFEQIPVHLVKDGGEQHLPDYQKLNPLGQVPYLVTQDLQLSQSVAIIKYLDQIDPQNCPLFLAGSPLEPQVFELVELINSGIQPIQNLSVLQKLKSEFGASPDQVKEWCKHWITVGFRALERLLQKRAGKYSLGNQITAADLFLVPQVYNANRFEVRLSEFPLISKINESLLKNESFQKAHPDQQPDSPT